MKIESKVSLIILVFYVGCLFFPAYQLNIRSDVNYGYFLILIGWLGVISGHFSWFANIFILVGIKNLYQSRFERAGIYGSISFLLVLSFWLADDIMVNENGNSETIEFYLIGYWLWLAASLSILLGAVFLSILKHNQALNRTP